MIVQVIFVVFIVVLFTGYLKGRYNEYYWKKRGVKFHPHNKLFGSFWDFMTQDRAFFKIVADIHFKYKDEPLVGLGSLFQPLLYVKDPQIIHSIYQADFKSFHHRGVEAQPGDKLADNITFMYGNRWKLMRQSFTPLFTASKLKSMFYIIDKSSQDLIEYLENNPEKLNGDAYKTILKFCNATVAAAVFGINTESVFDSPFLAMARKATESNFWTDLRFSILILSPWLFRTLGLSLFGEHEEFFIGAIKKTVRQREVENVKRHDFADMCIAIQKSGQLKDANTGLVMEPTDELMAAQGFFFFIAGVEPSATAFYCVLLELGLNPRVLKQTHEEIDHYFKKHDGRITFDVVAEMKYLDMVFNESVRKYPPIGLLTRECVQDTVLPEVNVKIDKGTKIWTSIYSIHNDPDLYPDPESFIPERFESNDSVPLYVPFGKGNRTCIGERFARVQVKTGLVYLLRHYTVKTYVDGGKIEFLKKQFQVMPSNTEVKLIKRDNIDLYVAH